MDKYINKLKKEFSEFIANIPFYIGKLNSTLNCELTYEFADIDKVQNLFETNFNNPEKIGFDLKLLNNCLYAYMGEAFIYYNGGYWILSDSKRDRAYGTPIITGSRNSNFTTSPYIWKEYIVRDLERQPISKIIKLLPSSSA